MCRSRAGFAYVSVSGHATETDSGFNTDVWMMRPDGTDRRPVIETPGRDELAFWRPR